jgi:DUF4097 and DUF4098 domain-containing protein YvlB
MRPLPVLVTLCLGLVLPGGALADPLSKPLRSAHAAKSGETIVLENLAGRLEVVAGQGAEAVLTGTAWADAGSTSESQRLLDAVTVDVRNGSGRLTLHVTYPVDRAPFRYRGEKKGSSPWSRSSSTVDYQGRRLTVTEGGGSDPLLYADLRLEVPPGVAVHATNHLGRVTARGVGAGLEVKTASADVAADDVTGALKVRTGSGDTRVGGSGGLEVSTGSGDVAAERIRGSVSISTGSGDVKLDRSSGQKVSVHTGSGDVSLDDVAGSLELQTGSGDIAGRALREVERLNVETGSGQVSLSFDAAGFAGGEVEAASGDVDLSLSSAPALTLSVSTASGDIDTGGLAVTRVAKRTEHRLEAEVKGGGAPLRIHTASGNVRLR